MNLITNFDPEIRTVIKKPNITRIIAKQIKEKIEFKFMLFRTFWVLEHVRLDLFDEN